MSFMKSIASTLIGDAIGSIIKSALGGKKKKGAQAPVPTPTRNMAAEAAAKSDLLARRRGVVANLVMGAGGGEANVGGGTKLGN